MKLTLNKNETALTISQEYPKDKYNLLIPVKSMHEISPIHKVIINEVKIDSDEKGKDVYKEKNGEFALSKKGLSKLMAAANIQLIDSRSTPPQKCERCFQMAERTRIAPRCGDCDYADDVAYQITLAVPEPSGTYRMVKATKELRMKDEKGRMSDKQFTSFFPYRTEQCESKALNRALREALMLSATYKKEELERPFAVALVAPNFSDPDMKKAMVERYTKGTNDLFGPSGNSTPSLAGGNDNLLTLPGGQKVDTSSGEIIEVTNDDLPAGLDAAPFSADDAPDFGTEEMIACEGDNCGKVIEAATDNNGKEWSAKDLAEYTQKTLGEKLCIACLKKSLSKAGGK